MTHELRLSDIGEGLEEAEIIEWKVSVGDTVTRDQPIVEIMTDKSNAELPAPVDGVVVELGGAIGDVIEVGHLVAVIDASGAGAHDAGGATSVGDDRHAQLESTATTFRSAAATAPVTPDTGQQHTSTASVSQPLRPRPEVPVETAGTDRPKAAPSTRAEAARRGIDLSLVEGSGPGGRILLADLDRHGAASDDVGASAAPAPAAPPSAPAPSSPPASESAPSTISAPDAGPESPPASEPATTAETEGAPSVTPAVVEAEDTRPAATEAVGEADGTVEPLRGVRRVIAANMAQSWSTIPHIHASELIDAEPMLAFRNQLRSSGRDAFERLTPVSFFVGAVAAALTEFPIARAHLDLDAGTITHSADINIGIAVASPNGLVVPVLRNAGTRSLSEIAVEVRRLVAGAREGSLDAAEYRGGTTTITNFGSLGGELAQPLIRPGESTIFGFGSIAARPFVINDAVVARSTMHCVVGADHRLLDGDVTTALLRRVADLLATPINLVLG